MIIGRILSSAVGSQRWVLVVIAMLLFFMGGIWFYPFVKEEKTVLLIISIINQLSCLAFILGSDFGCLHRGSTEWKSGRVVLISSLLGFFSVAFSALWVKGLVEIGIEHEKQEMVSLLVQEERGIQIGTIFFVIVIAPVVEEMLFRNVLLPSLAERFDDVFAIVLTGILFGVMHLESLTSVPPLILFGILLGVLRQKYKSVMPAIIAHFANNSVVVCFMLFF